MWTKALVGMDGAKVPMPWDLGIQPMRGQLVVVMGSPGIGKSAFALNWALRSGEPSSFLSLDTDLRTQAARTAAMHAGVSVSEVMAKPEQWSLYLERQAQNLRMYDLTIGTKELMDLVLAEKQYWGKSPSLLVVDNVSNLLKTATYDEYRTIFIDLHKIARRGDTCVVALHHTRRDEVGALSLHSGQYGGEQEAEIVVGLWRREQPGLMDELGHRSIRVGVLKNRNGIADTTTDLMFYADTMRLETLNGQSK